MFASILKNLTSKADLLYSTVLKFNPSHDKAGRFAPTDGGVDVYHGTASAVMDSILKEGLTIGHPPQFKGGGYSGYYKGDRKTSVFVTADKERAVFYAEHAARNAGPVREQEVYIFGDPKLPMQERVREAVVIHFKVPRAVADLMVPDEKDKKALRSSVQIDPKYIVGYDLYDYGDISGLGKPKHNLVKEEGVAMYAVVLIHGAEAQKSDLAKVLKFNPYHDQSGRFATHGSATFVSLSGKRYANILDPKNQGKNLTAAQQNYVKLETSAYNFGKNLRATSSSDIIPGKPEDQAQLQAGLAKAYAEYNGLNGGADVLNNAIANAYNKVGLGIKQKESLGIPLTQQEHNLIAEGLKAQNDKASAKAMQKAANAFNKAYVKSSMDQDKYEYQNKPAKQQAAQAKLTKLGEAFLAAGGTQEQLVVMALNGLNKKDAEQKTIKALITTKALEYYKAHLKADGPNGTQADKDAVIAMNTATNKLWNENKSFLGTDPSALTYEARQLFSAWKAEHKADYLRLYKQLKDDVNASPNALGAKADELRALGFPESDINSWAKEGKGTPTSVPTSNTDYENSVKANKLAMNVYDTTKALHGFVLAGADEATLSAYKAKQVAALDAAEASGLVDKGEVAYQRQLAEESATKQHDKIVGIMKKELTGYAESFAAARLSGDTATAAAQGALFHEYATSNTKLLTPGDLATIKNTANENAEKAHKAIQAFQEAVGDPHKTAAVYDAAGEFNYPKSDMQFAQRQDAMIAKLDDASRMVLMNYTGSSYTGINKAVGTYGTKKMLGLNPEPLDYYTAQNVKDMDAAFSKITLGQNVALRRNMPQKYFWGQLGISSDKMNGLSDEQLGAFVGKVYKETAFGSASMDPKFGGAYSSAGSTSGLIKLNIRANSDTHAVRVASISSHDDEQEVIMGRGTTYVIRAIRRTDKGNYRFEVDADVIGTFPDTVN